MLASVLRTDPHCLRRLEATDPAIVELREWSRLSEDLTRERVRLANRMRQQLWRYPQFLDAVDDDAAAPWALDLWRSLPTPRAGQRVREVTRTRVLKQHRIRRTAAATRRAKPRAPAVKVAPGAVEAAVITHVQTGRRPPCPGQPPARSRAPRARQVGGQLAEAAPADDPDASTEAEAESSKQPPDAPSCSRCPVSAPRCSPRWLPRVATPYSGGTMKHFAVCGGGFGHPAFGQEPGRDAASGGPRTTARRRLPLGPRRRPTRSGQPGQASGATRPAATDTPAPCVGSRPPAQRRLRDAARRRLLRPARCRDYRYVSRISDP